MKKFWTMRNYAEGGMELLLYGDISSTSWFGDEVTPKQFSDDLNAMGAVDRITVGINSGGGDVFAAQAIGNLLEQHPATVTARIDGLCASAATIVACHCDKVVAAADSTYMIHPAALGLCGQFSAEELTSYAEALQTVRENILTLYARKTGRDQEEVAAWMDGTSWLTAQQAMERGFVDELTGQTVQYENRDGALFVNSVGTGLSWNQAPAFVRGKERNVPPPSAGEHPSNTAPSRDQAPAFVQDRLKDEPEDTPENKQKEEPTMEITTVDELREAYPDLVNQLEQAAAQNAIAAERTRISEIEDMALDGSEELTREAKFTKPMSAEDYAKAVVKNAKAQGAAWLQGARTDAQNAGQVTPDSGTGDTDEFMNALRTTAGKDKEGRK